MKKSERAISPLKGLGRFLLRLFGGVFALLLAVSLASFHPLDAHPFAQWTSGAVVHNLCGSMGATLAGVLMTLAGVGSWLVPAYVAWECFPFEGPRWLRRIAWSLLAVALWTLLGGLGTRAWPAGAGVQPVDVYWGGWAGRVAWTFFYRSLGPVGLPVLFGTLVLLCALVLAPVLTRTSGELLGRWMGQRAWPRVKPLPSRGLQRVGELVRGFFRKQPSSAMPDLTAEDALQLQAIAQEDLAGGDHAEALRRAQREANDFRRNHGLLSPEVGLPVIHSMNLEEGQAPGSAGLLLEAAPGQVPGVALPPPALLRNLPPPPPPKKPLVEALQEKDRYGRMIEQQPLGLTEPTPSRPLPDPTPSPSRSLDLSMVVPERPRPLRKSRPAASEPSPVDRLELPPRRLFNPPNPEAQVDRGILDRTREHIGLKLTEFKVKGQVVGYQPGPVVTVYEFQPDPGVPLAKVMGMEEDLALGLKAEKVRIDRIAGKNLVGIEVPNPSREIISFREVVDSPQFRDPSYPDARSLLTMALGKDMAGHPVVTDLAKMPHLLIGGSTGSGKSVGVNAMICSLLLRALPSEVKLILVDPKMVELGPYENIPHLWAPVVTDMKEAGRVLKWVVAQMEDRYRRLVLLSVRNLEQFNTKIQAAGGVIDISDRTPNPRWMDRPCHLEPLPYVVVVIDELADLMMVARSEVEESIARLAQKARAVGIHLILATQRPSVDIVTGVIKANLSCRLSYRVNTKIDSRTILDGSGGEQLLGKGDALFLAPGAARPRRIHAPFLTEEEILRLVDWLKEQGRPEFNQALMQAMTADEDGTTEVGGDVGSGSDDMYDRAVAVVKRERKASTSLLQRKLNLGYGRAARLIDRMEEEGIIGPDRGAGKPREVLTGED